LGCLQVGYQRRSIDCCRACLAVSRGLAVLGSGFGWGFGFSFMVRVTFLVGALAVGGAPVVFRGS
jgi:hypothetical protein